MKISDSEMNIMTYLWRNGRKKAADIAKAMDKEVGWNKNTTYTIIKRCIEKELIIRSDPGYVCTAAISKRNAAKDEIREILKLYFNGSVLRFFLAMLEACPISKDDAKEIKSIVRKRSFYL